MSGINDPQPIEQPRPSDDSGVVYVDYCCRGHAIVEEQFGREQLTPEWTLELANHSPSGFSRGYAGSGPAQLVLALLLDYTDDEDVALEEYMEFKTRVVGQLEYIEPDGCWRLTGCEIDTALREAIGEPVVPSVN